MNGITNALDMAKKFLLKVFCYNLHQHLMGFKRYYLKSPR